MNRICEQEIREAAAESAFDRMDLGGGNAKCWCGKVFKWEEGISLSPNPYAMPVCPDCGDEEMKKYTQKG